MNEVSAQSVLEWLCRMQKKTQINRDRAEVRPGVTASELAALELKLSYINYLVEDMRKKL